MVPSIQFVLFVHFSGMFSGNTAGLAAQYTYVGEHAVTGISSSNVTDFKHTATCINLCSDKPKF